MKWQEDCFPKKEQYALCSCGESSKSPYCDGTHQKIGYDGAETAGRGDYLENPEVIEGPDLILPDAQKLCALAGVENHATNPSATRRMFQQGM